MTEHRYPHAQLHVGDHEPIPVTDVIITEEGRAYAGNMAAGFDGSAIGIRLAAHEALRRRGRAMGATKDQIDEVLQRIYALPILDEQAAAAEALEQIIDHAARNRADLDEELDADGPLMIIGAIDAELAQQIVNEIAARFYAEIERVARALFEALRPAFERINEVMRTNSDAIAKLAEAAKAAQGPKPPPAYRQLERRGTHRLERPRHR